MDRPNSANLMHNRRERFRMLATLSVAGLFALAPVSISSSGKPVIAQAEAQEVSATQILGGQNVDPDTQLLLESDQLIYDNDRGLVIAIGNVQIAYGDYTLVSDKVEYNQQSGRVTAIGNVEILEPNGNRVFAEEIDITDDFRDGFISALKIETPDNTRISAESAERRDGEVTVFNNGVYTACEVCEKNPEKPPLWQIRAKKVIINNRTRTIEYEDASFEVFGKPVLRLARFSHADPAIKRKSGFLMPSFSGSDELGLGVRNAYFLNLAPNFDLTLAGTYYTRQGFLGEVEWRQRTENGEYSIRYAGIDQQDSAEFSAGSFDAANNDRQALMTNGLFKINPRWKFGWNVLYQSDDNFARTYSLEGYDKRDITNEIYLTGLSGKNFFDLRGQDFLVQDNQVDFDPLRPGTQTFTGQQATVLPLLDYNVVSGEEFSAGQLSFDLNVTSLSRDDAQNSNLFEAVVNPANDRFTGIQGNYTRASAEAEWKGSQITGGAVITTSLSARGDGIWLDTDNLGTAFNPLTSNDSIFRTMPAAMVEIRYPFIATDGMTSRIFEPIVQIIARPDETDIGALPNEDAQSLVFDTTNLFERDKYSGFDRVEGGTRANVGFRYSASFYGGASLDIVAGQSFQLAGQNSFAQVDVVNAGLESGLETDRSDYVASLQYNTGQSVVIGVGGRFDEQNFTVRRVEVGAKVIKTDYSANATYTFTEAQPNYRFDEDRHEIKFSGSVKLAEYWRAFGAVSYDIRGGDVISDSVGLAYEDACFSFSVNYSNNRDGSTGQEVNQSVGFRIGLRTLGEHGFTHKFNE